MSTPSLQKTSAHVRAAREAVKASRERLEEAQEQFDAACAVRDAAETELYSAVEAMIGTEVSA